MRSAAAAALLACPLLLGACERSPAPPAAPPRALTDAELPPNHAHPHPVAPTSASAATAQPSMHPGTGDRSVCTCHAAKLVDGWCEFHQEGWVGGLCVRSAQLFDTVDPHGHEIGHDSITCATCRAAISSDDYCPGCHIGWNRGLAYMTRLTWLLSKGTRVTDGTKLCASCRLAANAPTLAEPKWCATCGGGVVGNVFFADRRLFDECSKAHGVMRLALGQCARCELCACAIVYDRTCPDCGITYRDGVAVATNHNGGGSK